MSTNKTVKSLSINTLAIHGGSDTAEVGKPSPYRSHDLRNLPCLLGFRPTNKAGSANRVSDRG